MTTENSNQTKFHRFILMHHNGLAKLRGRFQRIILSNRAEASRLNLFIFLSKPILVACWCFLIELTLKLRITAHEI